MIAALGTRWRLLDSGPADGATNMAVDAALLAHARRTGEATLRLYAWSVPTLSFGRHERARGAFDLRSLAAHGVAVVRRPTGGRALLHDREVTYCVTAPATGSLAASYAAINGLLVDALARLGVRAAPAAPEGRPLRPDGAACFAEPAPGELTVDGAKLVGSAQLREDGALLQHGSILLEDDQSRIAALRAATAAGGIRARPGAAPGAPGRLAPEGAAATLAPVATLRGALGREVRHGEVVAALVAALHAACARAGVTSPSALPSDSGVLASAAALRSRFEDPDWTWRR